MDFLCGDYKGYLVTTISDYKATRKTLSFRRENGKIARQNQRFSHFRSEKKWQEKH